MSDAASRDEAWRRAGVRVIRADEFDAATAQTPGMQRRAALTEQTGATQLWAGTVSILPDARTAAHHHGAVDSVIYVVRGVARMRWGAQLEYVAEAGAGDFIHVPPYVPHQEINASPDLELHCVLVRSGQQNVVINLDIAGIDSPEWVRWTDDLHK